MPAASSSNLRTSARHLIGQRAEGWLNTLKDVKDKVQSVAPALPKLLPNTILEANVMNGAEKQYPVGNLPADACKNLAMNDSEREIQKVNNHCKHDQPVDAISAQLLISSSVDNDHGDPCHEVTTSESSELSSELSSKMHVNNLSESNHTCDQNSVASPVPDDNHNSIFGEHCNQCHEANNTDFVQHISSSQSTLSYEGEENLPSGKCELQQDPQVAPQSIRSFSTYVDDCSEIIFASARKRSKPTKRGIINLLVFICT